MSCSGRGRASHGASPLNSVFDGRWGEMRCSVCGAEHKLVDLEPSFSRPDEVVALPPEVRAQRVKEDDDLCRVSGVDSPDRYFVRCVLAVPLLDVRRHFNWGLWVEVERAAFERVVELWTDPNQAAEPPMAATIANRVPLSPDTHGLGVQMHLISPTSRASLRVRDDDTHSFSVECRQGVTVHRLLEWLEAMK